MLEYDNLERHILADEVFRTIAGEASKRNFRVYLVGGFIRDALLGLKPKDADFMFDGEGGAEQVGIALAQKFDATLVRFEKHMTVYRIVIGKGQYDLADLLDRNINEDQKRRDFTINSFAVEITGLFAERSRQDVCTTTGSGFGVIDATTSESDLENRLIRVNSESVLVDDPLRIIRLFRFKSQLRFEIDNKSLGFIVPHLDGLARIAGERVRDEMFQILKRTGASEILREMDSFGILTRIFPLIEKLRGVTQNEYHHLDVFEHTLDAISQIERILTFEDEITSPYADSLQALMRDEIVPDRPRFALLKLAMLFHDIGKPQTRGVRADGKVTFIGHDKLGAKLSEGYLDYLKLSRRENTYVNTIIEGHLRPGFIDPDSPTLAAIIFRYFDYFDEYGVDIVLASLADRNAALGEKVSDDVIERHKRVSGILLDAYFNRTKVLVRPPSLVDGNDLMRELGIGPGSRVGILLKIIREGQARGEVRSRSDAIRYAREFMRNSSGEEIS